MQTASEPVPLPCVLSSNSLRTTEIEILYLDRFTMQPYLKYTHVYRCSIHVGALHRYYECPRVPVLGKRESNRKVFIPLNHDAPTFTAATERDFFPRCQWQALAALGTVCAFDGA
jgi:hypothetical protein